MKKIVLANEKHFRIPPAQFARFIAALERPANVIPALRKLLTEESVIERSAKHAVPNER